MERHIAAPSKDIVMRHTTCLPGTAPLGGEG